MSVLNPITASIFGILAAAYWAFLFLRRVIRREPYANLTKAQKAVPIVLSSVDFIPALFFAYLLSFPIGNIFLAPGPAIHLELAPL